MRYAVTEGERSVTELAARLFDVGPRSAVARSVAKALTDANPELDELGDLPPGTLVEVPEVEDQEPAEELHALADVAPAGLLTGLREAVEPLNEGFAELVDAVREENAERRKALG